MFVPSISAFYQLWNRYRGLAIRLTTVMASFGLALALASDESGYLVGANQKIKKLPRAGKTAAGLLAICCR